MKTDSVKIAMNFSTTRL